MSVRRLGWGIAGSVVVVTGLAVWISAANGHYQDSVGAIAYLAFPVVGGLVAARLPRNPIGWLFLANGLSTNLDVFTRNYAERAVAEHRA